MVQHAKEGGHYKVVGKPFVVDVKFDFEDDENCLKIVKSIINPLSYRRPIDE